MVVAGASLASCGPGYSKLKVDELQSLSVATDAAEPGFCPYAPVALRALVTYRNGERATSRTPGENQRGRLRTSEFQWSSSHGTVDANAVLALPLDPFVWFDAAIKVTARVIARPEIVGEANMQPRFDCGGTLDYRGSEGARGGEAEDGGPGEPGPTVDVSLAFIATTRHGRLVLVRAQRGTDEPEYFVIDARPSEKPFVIDASGGAGGRGGQGTLGVTGRAGIDAVCTQGPGQRGTDGEPGGPGGPGHNGGVGGAGGRVLVRYDARFPELRSLIKVLVDGGEGGAAETGGAGGRGGTRGRGCVGSDGSIGADGADGAQGPTAPAGQPGTRGRPGGIEQSPAEVGALFATEIVRGIPLVTGAAEGR